MDDEVEERLTKEILKKFETNPELFEAVEDVLLLSVPTAERAFLLLALYQGQTTQKSLTLHPAPEIRYFRLPYHIYEKLSPRTPKKPDA